MRWRIDLSRAPYLPRRGLAAVELFTNPAGGDGDRLRLTVLGRVDLRDATGRRIQSVLSQPKRMALLTYLAMAGRDGFIRRDILTAVFWPNRDDERARKALRDSPEQERRRIEDRAIRSSEATGIDLGATAKQAPMSGLGTYLRPA
ncbi:MAG: hypothetical protein ACR2QM_19510 [Longimicrobiales bacterium]